MFDSVTVRVVMEWNEKEKKYLMTRESDGVFLNEFWDCGNVRMMFRGVNKESPTRFDVTVERLRND